MIQHDYSQEAMLGGEFFDSRTEAAWGAYFDGMSIPFVREPQMFVFPDGQLYTPDFYLPDQDSFVEVKNGNADDEAWKKIGLLARYSGKMCVLVDGMPMKAAAYFISSDPAVPPVLSPNGKEPYHFFLPTGDLIPRRQDNEELWQQMTVRAYYSQREYTTVVNPSARVASKTRKQQLYRDRVIF